MTQQSGQTEGSWVENRIWILSPLEQVAIPIPLEEWDRLISRINACKVSLQPWSTACSISLGIGVTSGLSIAPIAVSNLPWWVLTIYIVLCVLGLGAGVILFIAGKALARIQQSQIDFVTSDMERIRESFGLPHN